MFGHIILTVSVSALLLCLVCASYGMSVNDKYGVLHFNGLAMTDYYSRLRLTNAAFDEKKDHCLIKLKSTSQLTTRNHTDYCHVAHNCMSMHDNNCSIQLEKLGVDEYAKCYKLIDFKGVPCHLDCDIGRISGVNVTLSVTPSKTNISFDVEMFWTFARHVPIEQRNYSEHNLLANSNQQPLECSYAWNKTQEDTLLFIWFNHIPRPEAVFLQFIYNANIYDILFMFTSTLFSVFVITTAYAHCLHYVRTKEGNK